MSRAGDLITWWTGDSVMVFDANGLHYKYTVSAVGGQAPVGPATMMAGKLLVPVTTGYDVFDPADRAGREPHPADPARQSRTPWCPRSRAPRCSSSAATRWWRWAAS